MIKCYIYGSPGEVKVIAFNFKDSIATIENPDGSTQDIKVKALILESEEKQPEPSLKEQVIEEILEFAQQDDQHLNIVLKNVQRIDPTVKDLNQLTDFFQNGPLRYHKELYLLQERIEDEYVDYQLEGE